LPDQKPGSIAGLAVGLFQGNGQAIETFDAQPDMFIEGRFDGGPRLGLSFHGFVARKLNLSAHRIEVRCFGIPVPRSGTSTNEAAPLIPRSE